MPRLQFLEKVVAIEDKLQRIYNQASRKIKTLPLKPGSQVYAKAAIRDADQDSEEIIYNIIRQGAEMGEEEAIREQLAEMKRRWKT